MHRSAQGGRRVWSRRACLPGLEQERERLHDVPRQPRLLVAGGRTCEVISVSVANACMIEENRGHRSRT